MNPRIVDVLSDIRRNAQDFDPSSIEAIFNVPVEIMLTYSERLTLYTLIVGLQPDSMLEIGTWEGGSATVIVNAMDSIRSGQLICLDPTPNIDDEHWKTIEHRATLIRGPSPQSIEDAWKAAQSPFDLVFIDGYHSKPNVIEDILGVLRFLSNRAHLLFHDAYYPEIHGGINECLGQFPGQLQDCGVINNVRCLVDTDYGETPMCGMRLVVYRREGFGQQ